MIAAVAAIASALASAPTVSLAVPLAVSTPPAPLLATAAAALQRGEALPQHGGRRHELPGAQPVPPLGRALPLPLVVPAAAAAAARLAAALLGAVLAAPRLAAAADPTVARHGALPAVVQVAAELGREVARRFLQAGKVVKSQNSAGLVE